MKAIVIFDFDGTIADTLHLLVGALNRLSSRFRYRRITPEDIPELRGMRPRQIMSNLNMSFLSLPFVLKLVRREMNRGLSGAKPTTEMRDILLTLKRNGCEIGILTSNTEQNVKEFLINNNLDVFDFLYSGNSLFGKGRVLRSIIRKNRFNPNSVFYVGDEIRDIDAARKTGVTMIAVPWGFNTPDALRRAGPDHMVETMDDILKIILGDE